MPWPENTRRYSNPLFIEPLSASGVSYVGTGLTPNCLLPVSYLVVRVSQLTAFDSWDNKEFDSSLPLFVAAAALLVMRGGVYTVSYNFSSEIYVFRVSIGTHCIWAIMCHSAS